MSLIKSSNFKSGTFKGEEHSYISSINGGAHIIDELWSDGFPSEHVYFDNTPVKESDDIALHHDEGKNAIERFIPTVHRDLQALLYRGVCYVLSGFETKFGDLSSDVMKLIQNIVRLVDSEITIIHHKAEVYKAELGLSHMDQAHEVGDNLIYPTSFDTTVYADNFGIKHEINMFDTNGDTEQGRADLINCAIDQVKNKSDAIDILKKVSRGLSGLIDIANSVKENVSINESDKSSMGGGLRIGYLRAALFQMEKGIDDIVSRLKSKALKESDSLNN